GGQVSVQLGARQLFEKDQASFLPAQLPVSGPPPQSDSGPQLMLTAAQRAEDAARVGFVRRLADDLPIEPTDSIGGQDQAFRHLPRNQTLVSTARQSWP